MVDRVSDAQSVGAGRTTVTDAVVGMAAVSANGLAGVLAASVLALYRWELALGLLGVYTAVTWIRASQLRRTAGALRGHARRFRRFSYLRDLGFAAGAAKELRVFGLGPWLTHRFVDEWETAMAGFWRDRPRGRWVPPALSVLVGGALAVTYGLLARSAARGELSLGELTMFAGAAAGVAALSSVGMDNLNIGHGTAPVPAALELERIVAHVRFPASGHRLGRWVAGRCDPLRSGVARLPGAAGAGVLGARPHHRRREVVRHRRYERRRQDHPGEAAGPPLRPRRGADHRGRHRPRHEPRAAPTCRGDSGSGWPWPGP